MIGIFPKKKSNRKKKPHYSHIPLNDHASEEDDDNELNNLSLTAMPMHPTENDDEEEGDDLQEPSAQRREHRPLNFGKATNSLMPDVKSHKHNIHLGQMHVVSSATKKDELLVSVTPFYVRSTNGSDLRHYYFPAGKDSLTIKGSALLNATQDISATWLNIVGTGANEKKLFENNFQSTLSINPTYEYSGAHLHLRKYYGDYWGDVQLPVGQVRVSNGLKEYNLSGNVGNLESIDTFLGNAGLRTGIVSYPTPLYNIDATSAFSNPAWQYQKLSRGGLKLVGVGDTTFKLGMNYQQAQFFVKGVFPSGQQQKNEYMFEPQLGNGGYYGLGLGSNFTFLTDVWSGLLATQVELDGLYLFSNTQLRTFDITGNGTFSRYLQFKVVNAANEGDIPTYAGVNVLTKKTTVSPQGEINALLATSFLKNNVQLGLTYSMHYALQESISISDTLAKTYGFASTSGQSATVEPRAFVTNPRISSPGNSAGVLALNPARLIGLADLDQSCATKPSAATSQLAFSLGLQKMPWVENLGLHSSAGLAINHTNASLSTWFVMLHLALKV